MNIFEKRLRDVARACWETKYPDKFNMGYECDFTCGTPVCAIGNYAARPDLQSFLFIQNVETDPNKKPVYRVTFGDGIEPPLFWHDSRFLEYFGLNIDQSEELFGAFGCDDADTAEEAADFIDNWIDNRVNSENQI